MISCHPRVSILMLVAMAIPGGAPSDSGSSDTDKSSKSESEDESIPVCKSGAFVAPLPNDDPSLCHEECDLASKLQSLTDENDGTAVSLSHPQYCSLPEHTASDIPTSNPYTNMHLVTQANRKFGDPVRTGSASQLTTQSPDNILVQPPHSMHCRPASHRQIDGEAAENVRKAQGNRNTKQELYAGDIEKQVKYDDETKSNIETMNKDVHDLIAHLVHGSARPQQEMYFDAVVVYDREDSAEVKDFILHVKTMCTGFIEEPVRIELFDSPIFNRSYVSVVGEIVEKCSVVFVYLTNRCRSREFFYIIEETVGLSRLGLGGYSYHSDSFRNMDCAIKPVHTEPVSGRSYKTPMGLLTLKGIDWYNKDVDHTKSQILHTMKAAVLERKRREGYIFPTAFVRESEQYMSQEFDLGRSDTGPRRHDRNAAPSLALFGRNLPRQFSTQTEVSQSGLPSFYNGLQRENAATNSFPNPFIMGTVKANGTPISPSINAVKDSYQPQTNLGPIQMPYQSAKQTYHDGRKQIPFQSAGIHKTTENSGVNQSHNSLTYTRDGHPVLQSRTHSDSLVRIGGADSIPAYHTGPYIQTSIGDLPVINKSSLMAHVESMNTQPRLQRGNLHNPLSHLGYVGQSKHTHSPLMNSERFGRSDYMNNPYMYPECIEPQITMASSAFRGFAPTQPTAPGDVTATLGTKAPTSPYILSNSIDGQHFQSIPNIDVLPSSPVTYPPASRASSHGITEAGLAEAKLTRPWVSNSMVQADPSVGISLTEQLISHTNLSTDDVEVDTLQNQDKDTKGRSKITPKISTVSELSSTDSDSDYEISKDGKGRSKTINIVGASVVQLGKLSSVISTKPVRTKKRHRKNEVLAAHKASRNDERHNPAKIIPSNIDQVKGPTMRTSNRPSSPSLDEDQMSINNLSNLRKYLPEKVTGMKNVTMFTSSGEDALVDHKMAELKLKSITEDFVRPCETGAAGTDMAKKNPRIQTNSILNHSQHPDKSYEDKQDDAGLRKLVEPSENHIKNIELKVENSGQTIISGISPDDVLSSRGHHSQRYDSDKTTESSFLKLQANCSGYANPLVAFLTMAINGVVENEEPDELD